MKYKVPKANKVESIDNDAKLFQQQTNIIQFGETSQQKAQELLDAQAYEEKTKSLAKVDDYDVKLQQQVLAQGNHDGNPMCINGPCGNTWPHQEQVLTQGNHDGNPMCINGPCGNTWPHQE